MKTVVITGGAGYVGSQSLVRFKDLGWRVIVVDDLSTGHRDLAVAADELVETSLLESEALAGALDWAQVDGILHCAAKALVPESVARPEYYFRQNVVGALNLLDCSLEHRGIPIVFSSTAATFGQPESVPIPETAPTDPINPYGFSKLAVEKLLFAASSAYGGPVVALRYFNAAGADPEGRVGERHDPETHLIPNAIRAAHGSGAELTIFGDDYDTRDGTCLRDYIHVSDLAEAHRLALEYLWGGGASEVFNLGSAEGFTVKEVVETVAAVVGRPVPHRYGPRRPGDPDALLADSSRAREVLGWSPRHSDLRSIVTTAARWHDRDG